MLSINPGITLIAFLPLVVIQHFSGLNDDRRRAALKDRLFTELLNSIFRNSGNLGIGIILLLAAQSLKAGNFTVLLC